MLSTSKNIHHSVFEGKGNLFVLSAEWIRCKSFASTGGGFTATVLDSDAPKIDLMDIHVIRAIKSLRYYMTYRDPIGVCNAIYALCRALEAGEEYNPCVLGKDS